MGRRIKLPVGRHGRGEVGKAPLVAKKNAESDARERERRGERQALLRFTRQANMLKSEHGPFVDKWKYRDNRRPPGVGHFTNDPLLSGPSKVLKPGGYSLTYDAEVMDPFACGTAPVFTEEEDWRGHKVTVNKSSFPTLHLPWIGCPHCLVIIDWGLTSGFLEVNELGEAVDPRPDDVERKKLRQRWRRLLRARREPNTPSTEKTCSSKSP